MIAQDDIQDILKLTGSIVIEIKEILKDHDEKIRKNALIGILSSLIYDECDDIEEMCLIVAHVMDGIMILNKINANDFDEEI